MSLSSLRIHMDACKISGELYEIVKSWPYFDRDTLGKQLIRAVDSISHNIAEGYGRAATGERLQFMFYADASIQEAKNQIQLASDRLLISEHDAIELRRRLMRLSISLIEFAAAIAERDKSYKGRYIGIIHQRRAWLLKQYAEKR